MFLNDLWTGWLVGWLVGWASAGNLLPKLRLWGWEQLYWEEGYQHFVNVASDDKNSASVQNCHNVKNNLYGQGGQGGQGQVI